MQRKISIFKVYIDPGDHEYVSSRSPVQFSIRTCSSQQSEAECGGYVLSGQRVGCKV